LELEFHARQNLEALSLKIRKEAEALAQDYQARLDSLALNLQMVVAQKDESEAKCAQLGEQKKLLVKEVKRSRAELVEREEALQRVQGTNDTLTTTLLALQQQLLVCTGAVETLQGEVAALKLAAASTSAAAAVATAPPSDGSPRDGDSTPLSHDDTPDSPVFSSTTAGVSSSSVGPLDAAELAAANQRILHDVDAAVLESQNIMSSLKLSDQQQKSTGSEKSGKLRPNRSFSSTGSGGGGGSTSGQGDGGAVSASGGGGGGGTSGSTSPSRKGSNAAAETAAWERDSAEKINSAEKTPTAVDKNASTHSSSSSSSSSSRTMSMFSDAFSKIAGKVSAAASTSAAPMDTGAGAGACTEADADLEADPAAAAVTPAAAQRGMLSSQHHHTPPSSVPPTAVTTTKAATGTGTGGDHSAKPHASSASSWLSSFSLTGVASSIGRGHVPHTTDHITDHSTEHSTFHNPQQQYQQQQVYDDSSQEEEDRVPSAMRLHCLRCRGTVEGPRFSTCKCPTPALVPEDLHPLPHTNAHAHTGSSSSSNSGGAGGAASMTASMSASVSAYASSMAAFGSSFSLGVGGGSGSGSGSGSGRVGGGSAATGAAIELSDRSSTTQPNRDAGAFAAKDRGEKENEEEEGGDTTGQESENAAVDTAGEGEKVETIGDPAAAPPAAGATGGGGSASHASSTWGGLGLGGMLSKASAIVATSKSSLASSLTHAASATATFSTHGTGAGAGVGERGTPVKSNKDREGYRFYNTVVSSSPVPAPASAPAAAASSLVEGESSAAATGSETSEGVRNDSYTEEQSDLEVDCVAGAGTSSTEGTADMPEEYRASVDTTPPQSKPSGAIGAPYCIPSLIDTERTLPDLLMPVPIQVVLEEEERVLAGTGTAIPAAATKDAPAGTDSSMIAATAHDTSIDVEETNSEIVSM
jgi:hypothetical protein